jgi:hypothetical protein
VVVMYTRPGSVTPCNIPVPINQQWKARLCSESSPFDAVEMLPLAEERHGSSDNVDSVSQYSFPLGSSLCKEVSGA